MFHALYHTPVTILRLFMVYGPGQQDLSKLVPYVTLSLLKGEMPRVSSGMREVDWIYVDDVAAGYLAAATATGVEGSTMCPAVIRVDTGTGAGADPDGGCREQFSPDWLAHAGQPARGAAAYRGLVPRTTSARRLVTEYSEI